MDVGVVFADGGGASIARDMALTFEVDLTNDKNQSDQPQNPAVRIGVKLRRLPREGAKGSCGFGCLTASLEFAAVVESADGFAVEVTNTSGNSDESGEKEDHVEEFKGHYTLDFWCF